MSPTIQLIAVTLFAPAVCALVIFWLGWRFLPAQLQRGVAAIALGGGFWLGYGLLAGLQGRLDFAPTRHWQWIPYATLAAAAVAAAATPFRSRVALRWALTAAISLASAWLIVPTWPDLEPPRTASVALLAAYIFLLTMLLEPLESRLTPTAVIAQMAVAATCSAGLIAAFASLTYGEPAGIAAAALFGCALGAWLFPNGATVRAAALVYAVNVGGWAFTGAINPRPPLFALLITPLAPIALWVCAVGPLSRKRGLVAIVLQTLVVLVVLALAGGWAWLATSDGTDGEW